MRLPMPSNERGIVAAVVEQVCCWRRTSARDAPSRDRRSLVKTTPKVPNSRRENCRCLRIAATAAIFERHRAAQAAEAVFAEQLNRLVDAGAVEDDLSAGHDAEAETRGRSRQPLSMPNSILEEVVLALSHLSGRTSDG
jgi:hypothetical protein